MNVSFDTKKKEKRPLWAYALAIGWFVLGVFVWLCLNKEIGPLWWMENDLSNDVVIFLSNGVVISMSYLLAALFFMPFLVYIGFMVLWAVIKDLKIRAEDRKDPNLLKAAVDAFSPQQHDE